MSRKNKKEKKLATKPLLASQVEMLTMKVQLFNQVNALWQQRKQDIDRATAMCILELGVPEAQVGEWGLAADGKSIVRYGKKRRPPGIIGTTVKNRPKKKKPTKDQEAESDE